MTSYTALAGRLGAAAALASAASVLAACGSSSPSATPTTTVTVTATPGASASPSASATPSATPSGPPGCTVSDLKAALGLSQGTAGHIYQVVVLTSTSAATCTLFGYPGVSFVTGPGGSQIGAPATRLAKVAETLVTLAPGDKANMNLAITDAGAIPSSKCQLTTVHWLRIYPPGDFGALYLKYNTQACAKATESIMTVTAVAAGSGG